MRILIQFFLEGIFFTFESGDVPKGSLTTHPIFSKVEAIEFFTYFFDDQDTKMIQELQI